MSKMVRISTDEWGRKIVAEIIPEDARPIVEWYNEDFAKKCIEAPDDVMPNMLYDLNSTQFYPWCDINNDRIFHKNTPSGLSETVVNLL